MESLGLRARIEILRQLSPPRLGGMQHVRAAATFPNAVACNRRRGALLDGAVGDSWAQSWEQSGHF